MGVSGGKIQLQTNKMKTFSTVALCYSRTYKHNVVNTVTIRAAYN